MAKTVYCLFNCNEWKERSSMRLCAVCTSLSKLRAIIASGIRSEVYLYQRTDATSARKQEKQFKADWKNAIQNGESPLDLLDSLQYAYVEEVVQNKNPFAN